MKKLSLAMAVSLIAAASSVNAATVYKKDGFTFKVDGDIQVQLRQRVGTNEEIHVDIDDSELKNKISYDLGNGLTGFAEAHFDNGKDTGGAVESEETFVGLKTDKVKVQLGRMDYVTDEFSTERGIEEPLDESAFHAGNVDGSDVILVEAEAGAFTFAFSHDFGDSTRNTELSSSDVYVTAQVNSSLQVGAAYQQLKLNSGAPEANTSGFNAQFKIGSVDLAGDYSKTDENASNPDLEVTNFSVRFPVASTTKASIGVTNRSNLADSVDDGWYANVVYKFPKAKKVSLFAEIQDRDGADQDMGFLAGMRVKF